MSNDPTDATESRKDPRQSHKAHVVLRLLERPIEGQSENLSREGIMFYTDQELRVSVEFEGPDGPQTRSGRIVRVTRVSDQETGMAVEFDAE